jgi:hypothetical protein
MKMHHFLAMLVALCALLACSRREATNTTGLEVEPINSSFHYFPGVPICHSRDLQNWKQISNVLNGRDIARMDSKLLGTEMAGGFTGVTVGPYCRTEKASFQGFDYVED